MFGILMKEEKSWLWKLNILIIMCCGTIMLPFKTDIDRYMPADDTYCSGMSFGSVLRSPQ